MCSFLSGTLFCDVLSFHNEHARLAVALLHSNQLLFFAENKLNLKTLRECEREEKKARDERETERERERV